MRDKLHNVTRVDFVARAGRSQPAKPRATAHAPKLTEGVPLSMVIPRKLAESPELVMLGEPRSLPAEIFRRLRAILASRDQLSQVIVVTSPGPEEGRSAVATNLALAFAENPRERVLLLDADMRRPELAGRIQPEPRIGLAEILSEVAELEDALHHLTNVSLRVLPAGVPPLDPLRSLSSPVFGEVMCSVRERYDRIVIHAPPVLSFPDADLIGDLCDGTLVAVTAGATSRRSYLEAISRLKSSRVLGAVRSSRTLNLADIRACTASYTPANFRAGRGKENALGVIRNH